ncbi:hypothetical protein [Marinovum sp.]|uniref:hypothetical protein n=1 Tax=Marinovum sp. TaxID=2024839 RepID=UPI002B26A219|nr:hypothetical protein [Marinovum sp.]
MSDKSEFVTRFAAGLVLFLLALAFRALGADYGYFHGDERINDAARVLAGEIVPGQHFYPPLINYLNGLAFGGLFALGVPSGWWDGPGAFRAQYFSDPTVFYLTARYVTALIGALIAPLFLAIARRAGLGLWPGVAVGCLGVVFPLGVFMSHIAKGDVALATATIAVFWALIARLEAGRPGRWDIWLGVFAVLVVSFKQSGVFVLLPLAVGMAGLLLWAEGLRAMARSMGRALLTVGLLWPLLNIGILLDFGNFLAYQKIQTVMSLRTDAGLAAGLETLGWRSLQLVWGLNPVFAALALLTPFVLVMPACRLRHKPVLLLIWTTLVVGTLVLAALTGPRQPEHLWIASFAGFTLLGGLALAGLARSAEASGRLRRVAQGTFALGGGLSLVGAVIAVTEALAPPMWREVDAYIATHLAEARILTGVVTHLPQTRAAQELEIARWQRLAEKYDTPLPEIAEERRIREDAPDAVFHIGMPTGLYGLEGVDEDDPDYEAQPYAWPPQRADWQLDAWRAQGVDVFVVKAPEFMRREVGSPLMRAFFTELHDRCAVLAEFDPNKPLYLEREVTIYRCGER